MELEQRFYSVTLEAREEGDVGIIQGRPIVYNSRTNIGPFDEIIEPGALDGADLTDVRLCLNHDTSYVYARSRRNNPNSTMQLMPNEFGMDISASLNLAGSPKARDYYSAVQRQDIDKMSFMFSVAEDRWEDLETEHPFRHILKFGSIVEVSAVTFAAYNATDISARSKEALENARATMDIARRQKAEPMEIGNELELLKAKTNLY